MNHGMLWYGTIKLHYVLLLFSFVCAPYTDQYVISFCRKEETFSPNAYVCLVRCQDITIEIPMHLIFEQFVPEGFLLPYPHMVSEILPSLGNRLEFIEVGRNTVRLPGYFIPKLSNCDFLKDPNFLETLLNRSFIANPKNVSHRHRRLPNSFDLFIDGHQILQNVIDRTKTHKALKDTTTWGGYDCKPGETILQVLERLAQERQEIVIEAEPLPEYTSIEFTETNEHLVKFLYQYFEEISATPALSPIDLFVYHRSFDPSGSTQYWTQLNRLSCRMKKSMNEARTNPDLLLDIFYTLIKSYTDNHNRILD
jgi:hypothetical protein